MVVLFALLPGGRPPLFLGGGTVLGVSSISGLAGSAAGLVGSAAGCFGGSTFAAFGICARVTLYSFNPLLLQW